MKFKRALIVSVSLVLMMAVIGAYMYVDSTRSHNCDGIISIQSISLHVGVTASSSSPATSSLILFLNDPGPTTYLTSIRLTGSDLAYPITNWSVSRNTNGSINFSPPYSTIDGNALRAGNQTVLTYYPVTNGSSEQINSGHRYGITVNFSYGACGPVSTWTLAS